MRVFTAEQMQKVDQAAVQSGLSLDSLMDKAGQAVANAAMAQWPACKHILVLCGKGNNGGDGYVAARYLQGAAKQTTLLELANAEDDLKTPETKKARASFLAMSKTTALTLTNLQEALKQADLVIDALLGNGLSRPLEGNLAEIVAAVNASTTPVLSVDIPSGVDSDQSDIVGEHIQATRTLQLAGPKYASVFYPGKAAFASWQVADIGIPKSILESYSNLQLLDDHFIANHLPKRSKTAHKYTAGTVLVIAGSARYLGASELACRAAFRAGAGLVTLAAESRLPNSRPEIIFETLEWSDRPLEDIGSISNKRAQVRVIGPGLDAKAVSYLPELILQSQAPTVLDAGALTGGEEWFNAVNTHSNCVLTPHTGEAANLLEISSKEINKNPVHYARALAEKSNTIVILKGSTTVITAAQGLSFLSTRGHEGMATGGTGDVLAGILGAYLANAADLMDRACIAVYMHGLAGEHASQTYGNGLIASDLVNSLASVAQSIYSKDD